MINQECVRGPVMFSNEGRRSKTHFRLIRNLKIQESTFSFTICVLPTLKWQLKTSASLYILGKRIEFKLFLATLQMSFWTRLSTTHLHLNFIVHDGTKKQKNYMRNFF